MFVLKPEMAQELKQTNSQIYVKTPDFLNDSKFIATVGDISTINVICDIRIPDLMIIDYKTKRNVKLTSEQEQIINDAECNTIRINNPAGTISKELYLAIKKAIDSNKKTRIIVDGEEDLATLPVIKHCKNGAKVIYGMPDKGMVVVDVNQQTKQRANKLLESMLVK